jgi:hypothetical protein
MEKEEEREKDRADRRRTMKVDCGREDHEKEEEDEECNARKRIKSWRTRHGGKGGKKEKES